MNKLRSFICAGFATVAIALCASVSADAVPIDVGIISASRIEPIDHYPAPAFITNDHVAISADQPTLQGRSGGRSPVFVTRHSFADTHATVPSYLHIDPDIAGMTTID